MNFESNSDISPRNRSNTWPRNQIEGGPRIQMDGAGSSDSKNNLQQESVQGTNSARKPFTGRRNICGIYSYADLITQAITSSPNQKMSLSQIYQWMVENVEMFRDQSENSASWKNSVRHNLSLHNKFVRIQATGNAKGSLWTVDLGAKRTKFGRKRCTSVETPRMEGKTNTIQLQQPNRADQQSIDQQPFHPEYQMITDARYRTYSNGSTCLSPIRSEESSPTFLPAPTEYQNYYPAFRPRAYSNGSSWDQMPHSSYRSRTYSSCSGGTVSQEISQQTVNEMLNSNFQQGLSMQPFTPNHQPSYGTSTNIADNGIAYQYPAASVLQRPQSLAIQDSSDDINNIEVDTMRTPLECDVDAIVSKELTIEGVLDFDF